MTNDTNAAPLGLGEQTEPTPGPWCVTNRAIMSKGFYSAFVASVKADVLFGDWRANARLIAAAPQMLAALEAVAGVLEVWEGEGSLSETEAPLYREVLAAIKAAKTGGYFDTI